MTGARKNEALKATWSEFDLERKLWIKPFERTKQKRTEIIPLSENVMELLTEIMEYSSGLYLFPGKAVNKPLADIKRFWAKVLQETNIADCHIHDLRHTFASHLVSSGVSLSAVGKLLGHSNVATTERYGHLADQVLRDATNVMGDKITSLKKNGGNSQKS